MADEPFLTVAQVAELLKLNQQTVRNWIDEEKLPAVRAGRRVRLRRRDLTRFVNAEYTGGDRTPGPPVAAPPEWPVVGRALDDALAAFWSGDRLDAAQAFDDLADALRDLADVMRGGDVASAPADEAGDDAAGA